MDRAGAADGRVAAEATLGTLFGVFFKLGMTSFGGGLSGWIHQEIVRNRRWMDDDQFIAGVALTQVMPGPNAVNLALFIGQKLRGGLGLTVAGFGILFPPFLLILLLAAGYARISGLHGVQFVLSGMAAAGAGMSFVMGVRSTLRMRGAVSFAIAGFIFLAVGVLQWPMLPVVFTIGPLSVWLAWQRREAPVG